MRALRGHLLFVASWFDFFVCLGGLFGLRFLLDFGWAHVCYHFHFCSIFILRHFEKLGWTQCATECGA